MQLKNQKDFFSGLLSAAMGLLFAWTASRYSVGTAQAMGPGFFPLLLGALLTLLGGLLVFKALVFETEDGGRMRPWAWRSVGLVLLAGLLLGWLLGRLDALGWLPTDLPTDLPAVWPWAAWGPRFNLLPVSFGPPEHAALMALGLAGAMLLGAGSVLQALAMAGLGLLLGLVGADPRSGVLRFALEIPALADGMGIAVLALGVGVYGSAMRSGSLRWRHPALLLLSALAVYAGSRSVFDVWLLAGLGLAGVAFWQLDLAVAPLLAGFVLAPALEGSLRSALLESQGDWGVLVTRPWSLGLLLAALGLLLLRPGLHRLCRPVFGRFAAVARKLHPTQH